MANIASLIVEVKNKGIEATKRALKGLSSESKKTEKATDGLTNSVKNLAGAYLGIGTAVSALKKAISVNREFGVLKASLATATGSVESATMKFKELNEFAAKTPFQLNEVAEGFIKLKNYGLDPSERALTSYGDTVSALGKPLEQMVEAVADAVTGEFERLKEFAIKTRKEGDNITFTFRGVETTVKNSAEAIEGYLIRLGENNFAGAMADRMKTLDGAISNLQQNWTNLWSNEEGVKGVTNSINGLAETLSKPETQKGFSILTSAVLSLAGGSASAISTTTSTISYLAESVAAFFGGAAFGDIDRINSQIDSLESKLARRESVPGTNLLGKNDEIKAKIAFLKQLKAETEESILARQRFDRKNKQLSIDSALDAGMNAEMFGAAFAGEKTEKATNVITGGSKTKDDLRQTTDLIFEYTTGLEKVRMEYAKNREEILKSVGTDKEKSEALKLLDDRFTKQREELYLQSEAYLQLKDDAVAFFEAQEEAAEKAKQAMEEYVSDTKGLFKGLFDTVNGGGSIGDFLKGRLLGNISEKASESAASLFTSKVDSGSLLGKIGGLFFDNGGHIPSGSAGIVGEFGPEIVRGPANVTSRKDTAKQMGNTFNISLPGVTNKKDAFEARGQIERSIAMAVNKAARYT